MHAIQQTLDIDINHGVPIGEFSIDQGVKNTESGIVDQHIQTTPSVNRGLNHALYIIDIAYVTNYRDHMFGVIQYELF